jgi:predicted small secreted protein
MKKLCIIFSVAIGCIILSPLLLGENPFPMGEFKRTIVTALVAIDVILCAFTIAFFKKNELSK